MGRLRKEKGGKPLSKCTSAKASVPQPSKAKGNEVNSTSEGKRRGSKKGHGSKVLEEQILALGGDEEDLELVKDIENVPTHGPSGEDPALSKDVSKFLKGLSLSGDQEHIEEDMDDALEKKSKPKRKQRNPSPTLPKPQVPLRDLKHSKSQFMVQPVAQWYTSIPALSPSSAPMLPVTPSTLASLTSRASSLHSTDSQAYQTSSSPALTPSSADASFLHKILQSGTLSDRLSALTLLVQSSPVHNTKALDTLKGMAERGKGKGGREESLKALRCVVDWWVGGGAPDRKLKYFRDQPLQHPSVTDQHLVMWYFEDWLKKYFFSILQILEVLSLDPLSYVRTQALSLIFTLLRDKPEQEQNLLRLLVNKLGDTEKTICSRASYHLLHLLQAHPSMKAVIVREIVSLVLRPAAPPVTSTPASSNKHIRFDDNASKHKPKPKTSPDPKRERNEHARYYAAITFNQIVLSLRDKEVAVQLINVYFEIFKELLGEGKIEEETDGDDDGEPAEDKEKSGQDEKGKGKGKKGKARAREVKGEAGFAEVESAQSKLISAVLTGVNRALPFARMDAGDTGLNKHIDTLFLITHTSTFNISLQALVLIQQICHTLASSSSSASKSITDRYYRTLYTSLHDSRLGASSKQAMYLNLLFKSLKVDGDNERVKAFVRRFVQVLGSGGSGATEFVAGGLYLLGELFSTVPGLREMFTSVSSPSEERYDSRKRDPQFAHASASPLWELTPLVHHYHPAICLHASQLLSSQPLTASADLSLNTLSHFLDRFVYKNPKKPKPKGSSAMQPAAGEAGGVKLIKGEVAGVDGVVNDEKWWGKMKEGDVPVDQAFFHKYFSKKNEREKARAKKAEKRKDRGGEEESGSDEALAEDDEESDGEGDDGIPKDGDDEENSDLEEAEIWKAMKATMPKVAGDEDSMDDSDDIPSGLDEDDEDSEDEDDDGDEEGESNNQEAEDVEEGADDVLSLAEDSDNEDLIDLDADVPIGLIDYDGPDAASQSEEEWAGISADAAQTKRKRKEETDDKRGRRKKLRALPTFASYEDYAKMIEDGPEDDI